LAPHLKQRGASPALTVSQPKGHFQKMPLFLLNNAMELGQNFWWAQKFCPCFVFGLKARGAKSKIQNYGWNKG
jgi:hypothetical protein